MKGRRRRCPRHPDAAEEMVAQREGDPWGSMPMYVQCRRCRRNCPKRVSRRRNSMRAGSLNRLTP